MLIDINAEKCLQKLYYNETCEGRGCETIIFPPSPKDLCVAVCCGCLWHGASG